MFVYTIGDVIALLVYGTIALIAIIVYMADKKDKDPADSITVKSMFARLFAAPVKNKKIIGMTPDGGEVCFIGESNKIEFHQEGNITTFTAIGYHVYAGDRIAQMIIEKNQDVELVEVDELSETERGDKGFGSTGKR